MHAGDIQLWHLEATSCKLIKEWDDQRPIRIMRENISTIIPEDPPWFGDSQLMDLLQIMIDGDLAGMNSNIHETHHTLGFSGQMASSH